MIGAALCRLGWHHPDPGGQWNGGYCFTRCRRCGRDMVRSAFGEWHVPRDFRIVWGPKGSVADFDQAMSRTSLDARPAPPSSEPAPRPVARRSAPPTGQPRSPFDFDDFDGVEDGQGAAAPRRAVSP